MASRNKADEDGHGRRMAASGCVLERFVVYKWQMTITMNYVGIRLCCTAFADTIRVWPIRGVARSWSIAG